MGNLKKRLSLVIAVVAFIFLAVLVYIGPARSDEYRIQIGTGENGQVEYTLQITDEKTRCVVLMRSADTKGPVSFHELRCEDGKGMLEAIDHIQSIGGTSALYAQAMKKMGLAD